MKCVVCDSSQFTLTDGVFICNECSTQTKESQHEVSEHEGFSNRSLLSSKKKKGSGGAKGKGSIQLSPWTTTEAYNLIIYKQVSALIDLGASEKLKDVVLYIWSQYLQKCEIAFRKDYRAKEQTPRLSAFASRRDIGVLYGKGIQINRKKCCIKKQSKKTGDAELNAKEKVAVAETERSRAKKPDEDGEASTNDIEQTESDESASTSNQMEEVKYSSHALKKKKKIGTKRINKLPCIQKEKDVHHMTLMKTLSFCYLGLLYTENSLLLSDMYRLINEGKIPYINITDYFPPTMMVQFKDYTHFQKHTAPSLQAISVISAKLFDYLKLPKFKHRPLMPIAFRFVKDLNLPGRIIPIVQKIIDLVMEKNGIYYETKFILGQMRSIPPYELQAMASIIIALKLLYILDDKFEKEHSETMMKINTLLKRQQLFVWNEWRKQTSLKENLLMKAGILCSDFSLMESLNAENIISKCNLANFRRLDGYCKIYFRNYKQNMEGREEMKTILGDWVETSSVPPCRLSSFPLKYQLGCLMRDWKNLPIFKETQDIDFTFINKDFSSHLLFYRHDENASESEDLIYFLLSTLYESGEILDFTSTVHCLRTSKYWFKNVKKQYAFSACSGWLEKLPDSFAWLLKFMSKYIQVNCGDLYAEVRHIEILVFGLNYLVRCSYSV